MNLLERLNNKILYLDGGMGTLLQKRGLTAGELPEWWNISHPDVITDIHKAYLDAGSNVISTNTFGANSLKFSDSELDEIIGAAVANARRAIELSGKADAYVALDVGPSGKMLRPYGDLDFEDAVSIFSKTVELGVKHGVAHGVRLLHRGHTLKIGNDHIAENGGMANLHGLHLPILFDVYDGQRGEHRGGITPAFHLDPTVTAVGIYDFSALGIFDPCHCSSLQRLCAKS